MEIEVLSEEHLQLLAAAADQHDEAEFESIAFEHSEEDAFEDQAREIALQDVMAQKLYYENSLGLKLKPINFFYGGIRQMARAMPERQWRRRCRWMPEVVIALLLSLPLLSHRHLMKSNTR